MQRVSLSQYFEEVVHWDSLEETFEMCHQIGPLGN
jgi:hypothetical protein